MYLSVVPPLPIGAGVLSSSSSTVFSVSSSLLLLLLLLLEAAAGGRVEGPVETGALLPDSGAILS